MYVLTIVEILLQSILITYIHFITTMFVAPTSGCDATAISLVQVLTGKMLEICV